MTRPRKPGEPPLPQHLADIARKKVGGIGERRTALLLLGLRRWRGSRIVHDVDIPNADVANADHVVLTRAGLFVLDSKQFGNESEPGIVLRAEDGQIVHRSSRGDRPLSHPLDTLAWGCEAIGQELRMPARGVMVVHNANVQPGLTLRPRTEVCIDVVCADRLLNRLEGDDSPQMSTRELASARISLQRLRSATTGDSPLVVAPLGARDAPRDHWSPDLSQPPSDECANSPHTVEPDGAGRSTPPPSAPPVTLAGPSMAVAEVAGERGQPWAASIEDRWQHMKMSQPAAGHDVDPELQGLWRGDPISVIEFVGDDLVERDMVAMTGPCHGEGRSEPIVWACTPEHWEVYRNSRQHVDLTCVPLARVLQGSGGA